MPEAIRTLDEAAAEAAQVRPTPQQLAWQEMEFIAFAHFGVNTFTDREWGDGKEDETAFNPSALDAGQWAQVCRDAGIKMLILTAKHHDGFCLWPSRYTDHSVKRSPWRGGKGDVVREAAEACRRAGLKFGIYCSPWDRNAPTYGSPAYNDYFKNQLRELLGEYGPVAEVWFDGACGEGPNGRRQVYDWAGFFQVVRELQPEAVIGPCGPDVRWVGNESGVARETEWSVAGIDWNGVPPDYNEAFYEQYLHEEHRPGAHANPGSRETLARARRMVWWPVETDVSIRPGWFYHASEDLLVHSLERMVDIYYKSVGRNSVLLLNVPPDRRGLFHEHDVQRLHELRRTLDATFRENLVPPATMAASWSPPGNALTGSLEVDFGRPATFNRSLLQEQVSEGQRVEEYLLEAWHDGQWKPFARGTTIGHKKLDRFSRITASRIRLRIAKSRACPIIRTFGLYDAALGA